MSGPPAILRFVQDGHRGWAPGTSGRLTSHDVWWLSTASVRARARWPGPVGELVAREIWAYRDFGHRFGSDGLVPRIVAELLHSSSASIPAAFAAPSDSTVR